MKAKNIFYLLLMLIASIGFTACGDDDDYLYQGSDSGLKGWYIKKDRVAKQSDFTEINNAIENHELLSSYTYGGSTHNNYATYDFFIMDDGYYYDASASYGRLRFKIETVASAIHIESDNTLKFYNGSLYIDGYGEDESFYKLYAGPIFGNMAYYDEPTYYTYVQVDNKIVVSNGDIYTISSSGLIKDGESGIWSKYNPNTVY